VLNEKLRFNIDIYIVEIYDLVFLQISTIKKLKNELEQEVIVTV